MTFIFYISMQDDVKTIYLNVTHYLYYLKIEYHFDSYNIKKMHVICVFTFQKISRGFNGHTVGDITC